MKRFSLSAVGEIPEQLSRGTGAFLCFVLAAVGMFLHVSSAHAAPICAPLYAAQTINAGSVCVDNDTQFISITYTASGGWTLQDVHLFVGASLAEMPQTKTGNPKIGNFTYTDSAGGAGSYTFKLPQGDFAVTCGAVLTLAAHADLSLTGADGSVRSETGWAAGQRMVAKGNWATFFSYTVQCVAPPTVCKHTETAFAFGDQTFEDIGLLNDKRWGWQLTASAGVAGSTPIYAGAAQNDISKGTHVGTLYYLYGDGVLHVTYNVFSGSYSMLATHLYAGDVNVKTSAPGKYGNQHSPLPAGTTSDSYDIVVADANGDGKIYVVAHAEVCFY